MEWSWGDHTATDGKMDVRCKPTPVVQIMQLAADGVSTDVYTVCEIESGVVREP